MGSQHRAQTTLHLDAIAPVVSDLSNAELDEVLPVWRSIDESQSSCLIRHTPVTEVTLAHFAQQIMDVIDRQYRRRRIVNGRRQSFGSDIDEDAKREERILFKRAFRTVRHRIPQRDVGQSRATVVNAKQRITFSNKLANLGNELDHAIVTLGQRH